VGDDDSDPIEKDDLDLEYEEAFEKKECVIDELA